MCRRGFCVCLENMVEYFPDSEVDSEGLTQVTVHQLSRRFIMKVTIERYVLL